jgi:hypothetical protein
MAFLVAQSYAVCSALKFGGAGYTAQGSYTSFDLLLWDYLGSLLAANGVAELNLGQHSTALALNPSGTAETSADGGSALHQ